MSKKALLKNIKYSLRFLPDKMYIKLYYYLKLKKKCNIKNPKLFNEKIQWLKLNDRNPLYTKLVDKYEVKEYVKNIIGEEYIIPTLGLYNKFDDIDFDKLPNQFVIKCTHDSEGVVIVKDKNKFDIKKAKKKIEKAMKYNFYYIGREWPYKNIKPRIIIEKYMEDSDTKDLKDYKFFTFDGKIKCVQVDYDRFINHKRAFYDTDWKRLKFTTCYPTDYNIEIDCPKNFNKMKVIVEKIAESICSPAHVRIDLYSINNKIYFGEITFYHGSGFEKFYPKEWDKKLGECLNIFNDRIGE